MGWSGRGQRQGRALTRSMKRGGVRRGQGALARAEMGGVLRVAMLKMLAKIGGVSGKVATAGDLGATDLAKSDVGVDFTLLEEVPDYGAFLAFAVARGSGGG